MSDDEIEALIERAAERGARSALTQVGLSDEYAGTDIRELRGVLDAWRAVRRAAFVGVGQVVGKVVIYVVIFSLCAFAFKSRPEWLQHIAN